jgi:transposase InsO family protein
MSRKGNCWDNACAESFFKTLKRELETLDGRHSEAEVRGSVFMYLEAIGYVYIRHLTMCHLMGLTQD